VSDLLYKTIDMTIVVLYSKLVEPIKFSIYQLESVYEETFMNKIVVGILVPPIYSHKPRPSEFPIASALQHLDSKGVLTVFGFELISKNNSVWIKGQCINNNQFQQIENELDIIHDRFPSQIRNAHFQQLQSIAQHIPFGNPYSITLLCRDKLVCQRLLERHHCIMPEVVADFSLFRSALCDWGQGFLKPRYGALGTGVSQVNESSFLTPTIEGVVPGKQEPTLLQRGIDAPTGWAGMSVRQLMQRSEDGSWICRTAVLRRSKENAVVNVSRGAEAVPAKDFLPTYTMTEMTQQSLRVCDVLSAQPEGQYAVEFGLDFVIDSNYQPWLIEVNSRPRGRLETLALRYPDRFQNEHIAACTQPIRYLASLC